MCGGGRVVYIGRPEKGSRGFAGSGATAVIRTQWRGLHHDAFLKMEISINLSPILLFLDVSFSSVPERVSSPEVSATKGLLAARRE